MVKDSSGKIYVNSTWRVLNKVLNKKSVKQNLTSLFKSGNEESPDPI